MSRYGKLPIALPKQVEVKIEGQHVLVKGVKGVVKHELPDGLTIRQQEQTLVVEKHAQHSDMSDAMHGLHRALVNNIVIGVSRGFERSSH